jgi:broad specificity phosphatase PhoE
LTRFYFIRHGQSVGNAEGYFTGWMDSPLTGQGQREAEARRASVEALDLKPDRIVTSTLSRAIETASIINRDLALPVSRDADLREQNYGTLQGMDRQSVYDQFGPDHYFDPPGGETINVFTQRIVTALDRILAEGGLPLIVGHGGMPHALGRLNNVNLRGTANCALLLFEKEDGMWRATNMDAQTNVIPAKAGIRL